MEINNPKTHKTMTISRWKKRGLVYDDIDDLYYIYINTMNCSHCGKEFKNTRDRQLDHCHETGQFRKIVCQDCNNKDIYIRYPKGVPPIEERIKKYTKKWCDENRDKLREKITCRCGRIYTKVSKARHERSKIHIRLME
tara:strand:- start:57 stop:473 length:417 start_codon:yes stop_codon:yes gene_type:complete